MRCALLILTAALLLSHPAAAAPQVLGLQAGNGPVPLRCDDGECAAVVSTFCLQRERAMPTYGTPYRAVPAARLTLALTMPDGSLRHLPAAAHLRFAGYDGYTAIRISLPQALLRALGADSAAVEIGAGVSLVPLPEPGDDEPQSADEIALASGPMRLAASRYLDRQTVDGDVARLVTAMLSALPRRSRIDEDHSRVWETAVDGDLARRVDPAALASAHAVYDHCAETTYFRSCLLYRQRDIMTKGNLRFWDESSGY